MNRRMTSPAVIIALLFFLFVFAVPVATAAAAGKNDVTVGVVVNPVVTSPTGNATYTVGSTLKTSWTTNVTPASTGEFVVLVGNSKAGFYCNQLVHVSATTSIYAQSIVLNNIPTGSNYAVVVGYRAVAGKGSFSSYGTSPGRFTLTAASPSPTPTPTPTATPTPTPTATPTPTGPSVPAGYTLVQSQTITNLATNGLTNKYYYKCTFTGGNSTTAVLSFTGTSYNLVFDSCTIATGGGWNGVTINDANGVIHDIKFTNCLFKAQGRMGFECTSRPTSATTQYQHIDLLNSTFEPQGNEAVSYDGGAAAGNCTISGNTIEGAGNDPTQDWGNGLEINGPSNFTVTNNTIWQCRGAAFNFQRHVTDPCGWVVSGNVLDASHKFQATAQSSDAQEVLGVNVYGGVYSSNTIVSAAPGGSVAYLSNSHNMDWRTSTWRDAGNRSGYNVPTQRDGSANNLF